jgi:hypothetical protein
MKKNLQTSVIGLMFFVALLLSNSIVNAQDLVAFNFFGQSSYGTQNFAPTTIAADVTSPTGISRVGNIVTTVVTSNNSATANRWGGYSFAGGTTEPSLDPLVNTNIRYYSISLQPAVGKYLHIDSLSSMRILMAGASPNYFAIKYSLDDGVTFNHITTYIVTPKPTATSNQVIPKTDLTGVAALRNVAGKVIFMIMPYNGSNASGNQYNHIQFGNFAVSAGSSGAAVTGNAISVKGTVDGTLPVTLSSFTSSIQNQAALLNWATESEVNFDYFSVEKRTNNSEFKEIGRVPAKGGNTKTLYNFSDRNISFETNYYRLKMVDKDGTFEYSNIVTETLESSAQKLSIYPNPVVNQVAKVQFKSLSAKSSLKVVDVLGKIVLNLQLEAGVNTTDLDLSKITSGQYMLLLESNGAKVDYLKFVK